ncbi:BppU family phage baseplate upper protein [Bacillus thuringiensis]|uniref:BppU family phage baseplate upper protein n=1 Tax=Bacillus thuringiensis TaxID=1428 RepID=UPI002AB35270|nr:BppU family phage baseplate upper protein [Bacillus thuringiensis]MDY8166154.1 BppU family phage baseplate upper protein [Bacillus thuringiensis]
MKIKLVLDINKTQQAQLNAVVTGRQGDKATVTVNVFVVDGGVPYNLTGNTIYYEGLKPNNAYVRDTSGVKIINATQGNFEYTFRPETFGVAGIGKRSYFSIEQGETVRASTQDFGLVTLADAMTGNTMSGPYISELEELINLAQWLVDDINSRWTSINTQLTQLQNKLNTMDVVKRSGDSMTGDLRLDYQGTGTRKISFTQNGVEQVNLNRTGAGFYGMYDVAGAQSVWEYNQSSKTFNVNTANTNLLKKTGDTMTGAMIFDTAFTVRGTGASWDMRPYNAGVYSKGVRHTINTNNNYYAVAPIDASGTANWANQIALYGDTGVFNVASLTTRLDGASNIPLSAEATSPDVNYQLMSIRRNSTVELKGAVTLNANATGVVIATLPADLRPTGGNRSIYTPTADGSAMVQVFINGTTGAVAFSTNAKGKRVDFTITYLV